MVGNQKTGSKRKHAREVIGKNTAPGTPFKKKKRKTSIEKKGRGELGEGKAEGTFRGGGGENLLLPLQKLSYTKWAN